MATYTTNYHLEKPAQSDLYNIDVFNGNADTIDTTLVSKSNLSNLATVESTNKASKAYASGEYLVYNGLLYKTTSSIASGGTITPGTNCTQTNMGTQVTDLRKICQFSSSFTINAAASQNFNIQSSSRYLPIIGALNADYVGMYILGATGGGFVSWIPFYQPDTPGYTLSKTTNILTITAPSFNSVVVLFLQISGDVVTSAS